MSETEAETVRMGTLGDSEVCRRCGGENVCWYAPSPLWNRVMRGNDIGGQSLFSDLVCLRCFVVLAEEVGVKCHAWRLSATPEPEGLAYTTSEGWIWNPERDLWDKPTATTPEQSTTTAAPVAAEEA
jgi:hypothetical protein